MLAGERCYAVGGEQERQEMIDAEELGESRVYRVSACVDWRKLRDIKRCTIGRKM